MPWTRHGRNRRSASLSSVPTLGLVLGVLGAAVVIALAIAFGMAR